MPKKQKWTMPYWMRPYAAYINNTGGNDIEELVPDRTLVQVNAARALIAMSVQSQVALLVRLHDHGILNTDAALARRYGDTLAGIHAAVGIVLESKALPKKMRPGLQAIVEDIARACRP